MKSKLHSPCKIVSTAPQVLFLVEVFQQGAQIATHTVEAPDALAAIDQIEPYYSAPLELEDVPVDQDDSGHHHVMRVNNWRGYMFQARALPVAVRKKLGLQPGDHPVPASSSDRCSQTRPEDAGPL